MKLTRLAAAAGLLLATSIGGVAAAGSANAYPSGQIGTAQINATVFAPGETVVVTVQKTTPGTLIMKIFSVAPKQIGTGSVGTSGQGLVQGDIPAGYSGPHTIGVYAAGGETYFFQITVTSSGSGGGGGNGGGNGGGGGLANTGAAVTGIGVLGGILVAGGVFFVVVGRRRTVADQTTTV